MEQHDSAMTYDQKFYDNCKRVKSLLIELLFLNFSGDVIK